LIGVIVGRNQYIYNQQLLLKNINKNSINLEKNKDFQIIKNDNVDNVELSNFSLNDDNDNIDSKFKLDEEEDIDNIDSSKFRLDEVNDEN
jgi:hypothetical protein